MYIRICSACVSTGMVCSAKWSEHLCNHHRSDPIIHHGPAVRKWILRRARSLAENRESRPLIGWLGFSLPRLSTVWWITDRLGGTADWVCQKKSSVCTKPVITCGEREREKKRGKMREWKKRHDEKTYSTISVWRSRGLPKRHVLWLWFFVCYLNVCAYMDVKDKRTI